MDRMGTGMPNELHTMPVKVTDFLSSRRVRRMRLDELGAFWLLLMEAWLDGAALPNDEDELREMLGRDAEDDSTWQRLRTFVVRRMFQESEDSESIYNPTQAEVWGEVMAKHAGRVQAGRKGARKRWGDREQGAAPGTEPTPPKQKNSQAIAELKPSNGNAIAELDFANGRQRQRQRQKNPPEAPPSAGGGVPGDSQRKIEEVKRKTKRPTKKEVHDAAVREALASGRFVSEAVRTLFGDWMAERRNKGCFATGLACRMAIDKLNGYPEEVQAEALRNAIVGGNQGVLPEGVRIGPKRNVAADRGKNYKG